MKTVYINGKFAAQPLTGVQRFAREIVMALDARLCQAIGNVDSEFVLVVPTAATHQIPPLRRIRVVELPGRHLHFWEQVLLPKRTRGNVLLNLAGSAPITKWKQFCTFHDAAIFDVPEAYTASFVRWYRLLFRLQSRACLGLWTVSEFSQQRLAQHLHVPVQRLKIISNGSDHIDSMIPDDRVLAENALLPGRYFLAVGSANPTKNFESLLRAFAALEETSRIPLVVVGGSNVSVFSGRTGAVPTVGVVWTGRIDDSRLKSLYRHARAFVFPSLYEGFGIPPLEAMTSGCPVLASNIPAVVETCGSAAAYFDPRSVESIRDALERAAHDDVHCTVLRCAGHERAARFRWDAAAGALLESLRDSGTIRGQRP